MGDNSRYDRTMLTLVKLAVTLMVLTFSLQTSAAETFPDDLGTREAGVDWVDFLGPGRTSKSPETGLNTNWTIKPSVF